MVQRLRVTDMIKPGTIVTFNRMDISLRPTSWNDPDPWPSHERTLLVRSRAVAIVISSIMNSFEGEDVFVLVDNGEMGWCRAMLLTTVKTTARL